MDQLTADDPTRIGPYRLIARLGEGGMGLVYLGRSEGGRTVAVKVVQAEYAGHQEFRRRFAREVAAARRVGGSWTAAVLDADPEAAVPWVATQYIPGPDLHTVVAKDFGPLPEYSVHALANRLALALGAVHEAGLIHRDLKPSNVLVTVDGPRVIDFGIARAMDSLSGHSLLTRTGMLIGSPGFMSPEQVRGLELTPASDVFCLGAVLVYAATGRLLFGATETGLNAHLFRIAEEEADLTGVPEPLADLVAACLHKDPAQRPTPRQVAERTAPERAGEWLPGPVLAQLGRHAAQLLDFAPAPRAEEPAADPQPGSPAPGSSGEAPVPGPGAEPQPDPRVALARSRADAPVPQTPPASPPPPPAYSPTVPTAPAPPNPRRWWGLVALMLAQLTVPLETAAFVLGMQPVQIDLHASYAGPFTLPAVYAIAFGGLLLPGGYLGDRIGRKPALVIGLIGFAVASALGGSAETAAVLTLARALQGVFAALVTPSVLALVSTGFPEPSERRRAFGIYALVTAGGTALGLALSGPMLEYLSWRICLYVVVPLAVLALAGVGPLVQDGPRRTGAGSDLPGVLSGSLGMVALAYCFNRVRDFGWADPQVLVLLLGGAALFAGRVWRQRRKEPYVLRDRRRLGSHLTLILFGTGAMGLWHAVTLFLFERGNDYVQVGTSLLPPALAVAVGATQVSARLLGRAAPRALIAAGLLVAALGAALLAGLSLEGGPLLLVGTLTAGFGIGFAGMPLYAMATADIAPEHAGAAAANAGTAQQLGEALGWGLLMSASGGSYAVTFGWSAAALLLAALPATLISSPRAAAAS
ncbi:MFS transporter [Streptomyces sp. NPDC001606]